MKKRFRTVESTIGSRQDIVEFLNGDQDIVEIFDLPSDLPKDRIDKYKRLYSGIGNTPVYQVNLDNNNKLRIKAEYFNRMGNSHYSRAWIPYLFICEELGVITPTDTRLVETTSGNSGIALSMAAKFLNYGLTMVVPSCLPPSRTMRMEKYDANVIKVEGYIEQCIFKMQRLIVSENLFPCNHSEEFADVFVKIMKRIAVEYSRKYGYPDYVIAGLGNGISTTATFSFLRKGNHTLKAVIFHPDAASEIIYGLYTPLSPEGRFRHIHETLNLTDERINADKSNASSSRELFYYDTEICNLGDSSLIAIDIAVQKAKECNNKTFLTLAYDKNDGYL